MSPAGTPGLRLRVLLRAFAFFPVLMLAAGCGACTGSEGGVPDAHPDAGVPDARLPDLHPDLPPDVRPRDRGPDVCGSPRKIQPTLLPWSQDAGCGAGCRPVTGPHAALSQYGVQGDLLVHSSVHAGAGGLARSVYLVDLKAGKEWWIRKAPVDNRPGCFNVSTNGAQIAYTCDIKPDPNSKAFTEILHRYDPATQVVEDLYCYGLMSGIAHSISMGTTGVVNPINQGAYFVRFSDGTHKPVDGPVWTTSMSGSLAVWTNSAKSRIMLYDSISGSLKVLDQGPAAQYHPRISGSKVVWVDQRNDPTGHQGNPLNSDIYLHDLATGKTTAVCTHPAQQNRPDVDGQYVVWEDLRHNPSPVPQTTGEIKEMDIYLKDLVTGKEHRVTSFSGIEAYPQVDGGRVFFTRVDYNAAGVRVYMIDLAKVTLE